MRILVAAILIVGASCAMNPPDLPTEPVKPTSSADATIEEAIRTLRLELPEYCVIHEPPGIARGVRGKTADGQEVWLYGDRTSGFNHDETAKSLGKKPVIGVAAREERGGWSTKGTVIGYSHD
jgi:hypothetical protein